VVAAAAGNWGKGEEILRLLLEKRPDEVKVTGDVVAAAAGNWGSCEKIVRLLLEKRPDEVKVTEGVVAAAAGNGRSVSLGQIEILNVD
jgi:hypothetical protein